MQSFRQHPKNAGVHPISVTRHQQFYGGRPILKNPCDLWVEMQLMQENNPTVVIETGTYCGASALYYAINSNARVISVDLNVEYWLATHDTTLPAHPKITWIHGKDSTAPDVVERVKGLLKPDDQVMVVLDSCHFSYHVKKELEVYAPLVSVGQCIVIEDSFLDPADGPLAGIQAYFPREGWRRRLDCEEFFGPGLTYNPVGFWEKIAT